MTAGAVVWAAVRGLVIGVAVTLALMLPADDYEQGDSLLGTGFMVIPICIVLSLVWTIRRALPRDEG